MLYKEQMDSASHTGLDSAINVQRTHVLMAKFEVLKTLQNINRSRARREDYALDALSLQLGAVSSFIGAGLEITGHQNGGAPMAVGVALLGTTLCHARPVIANIVRDKTAQWKGFFARYVCPG